MYSQDVERLIQEAEICADEAGTLDGKANARALTALAAAVYYAANNASISVSLGGEYSGPPVSVNMSGEMVHRKPFGAM